VVFHICHSKVNMSGSLCFAHFCFLGGPSACVNFCKYWTKRMFTRCVNTTARKRGVVSQLFRCAAPFSFF
jgi:hypothetical protein